MEFPKNGKKAKNGIRQDEQLLINYSGGELPSESDSDRVKPLELPPTRLRRPKSRKIRVSSSNSKSVFSFWNFCQVLFVIVVIGTMVCMVWFTVVLKTSLDKMKKRVSILETSDRSTSKECADIGEKLQKKVETLRGTTAGLITSDEKHFKSLLQKIKILNKTVDLLKERLKSPKSVSSIHNDIGLLKKAMADTGREMTEVTDKVTQLRRIAHLQNNNIKHLKVQMYNVTVQLAKLSGKPTPRPVTNTGTPPWLLRVPADSSTHSQVSSVEMEKMRKNITSHMKKDIGKIVAYVKRANKSVHSQVHQLQEKLSALTKNFAKQKALIEKLMKKTHKDVIQGNTTIHHNDESIGHEISNLTSMLESLTSQFGSHSKRFDELVLDVTSINQTVHRHVKKNIPQTVTTSCNCSLESVWKAMSKDEENIKGLQSKLDDVRKSIEKLSQKETSTTSPTIELTTEKHESPNKQEQTTIPPSTVSEKVTSKPKLTRAIRSSTEQPTTLGKQPLTTQEVEKDTSTKANQTEPAPTTTATTTSSPTGKDDKRMIDEDDEDEEEKGDLNSWPADNSDEETPIPDDLTDGHR